MLHIIQPRFRAANQVKTYILAVISVPQLPVSNSVSNIRNSGSIYGFSAAAVNRPKLRVFLTWYYSPNKTSVFLLKAGSFTTSSYVTRSSWSNTGGKEGHILRGCGGDCAATNNRQGAESENNQSKV